MTLSQLINIESIGICGIPSLWVPKHELIRDNLIFKDMLSEKDRIERILKILQVHKKYENEKYFGAVNKRAGQ